MCSVDAVREEEGARRGEGDLEEGARGDHGAYSSKCEGGSSVELVVGVRGERRGAGEAGRGGTEGRGEVICSNSRSALINVVGSVSLRGRDLEETALRGGGVMAEEGEEAVTTGRGRFDDFGESICGIFMVGILCRLDGEEDLGDSLLSRLEGDDETDRE